MKYHLPFINTKMNTGNVSGDAFLAVNSSVHTWSSGHISSFNPLFPMWQHIYIVGYPRLTLWKHTLYQLCEISCHECIRFYVISLRILITCSFIHFVYIHRGTRYGVHGEWGTTCGKWSRGWLFPLWESQAQTQANGVDGRTLYPLGYLAGTSLFYGCFLDSQIWTSIKDSPYLWSVAFRD